MHQNWNNGIFCFTIGSILQALKEQAHEVLQAAAHAWAGSATQDGVTPFESHAFGLQPDFSIDYAMMERADNLTLAGSYGRV